MKKILLTLALVVYISPINYTDWKEQGNLFYGGFEGFLNFFNSISVERQEEIVEKGVYDDSIFEGDELIEWRDSNDLDQDWTYIVK
jgi:hypothetical protein